MTDGTIRYWSAAGRWVLAAVPSERAGVGCGVNNAVARVANEVGAVDFTAGFRRATWASAALCALGGVAAWATIRREAAPS